MVGFVTPAVGTDLLLESSSTTSLSSCNVERFQLESVKRKDCVCRRQFNEKPSTIPGCPG